MCAVSGAHKREDRSRRQRRETQGLADLEFASFATLEAYLTTWIAITDRRIHGTTHEPPLMRFERDEQAALRPLPMRALPRREQRLRRRIAHDALIDVDTVRYSVPHRLMGITSS